MPAGKLYIIITNIAAVPAKNHIAKAISALQSVNKFFRVDHFSAQNAINIGKGEFYFLDVILFNICFDLFLVHGNKKYGRLRYGKIAIMA
jgi:hypothetical protein